MSPDIFDRPALDPDAIDLAWAQFQAGHLSRYNAALAMTLAGVLYGEAQALLRCSAMPSNSGLLARTS